MKNKLILLAALVLAPAAFAVESNVSALAPVVTASLDRPTTPQKLEQFMVTGSLQEPTGQAAQLDKFLVTGSLQDAAQPQELSKFMVTGSLQDAGVKNVTLEKFMVTGSRESRPLVRLKHKR